MKLRDKAENHAIEECGAFIDEIYPTSVSQTLGDVAIEDFEAGYNTALKDFYEAIKANPKLSAKQILANLKKEI